jgi:hypothetical protein
MLGARLMIQNPARMPKALGPLTTEKVLPLARRAEIRPFLSRSSYW